MSDAASDGLDGDTDDQGASRLDGGDGAGGGRAERLRDLALTLAVVVESVPQVLPDAVTAVVALLLGFGVTEWTLSRGIDVAFLAAVFYGFAPTVFPADVAERRGTRRFRAVVAAVSLLFAVPVVLALSTTGRFDLTSRELLGLFGACAVLGAAIVLAYLRRTQAVPLTDPTGDAVAFVLARTDESRRSLRHEQARLARENPLVARVRNALLVGAGAATYVVPCALFGVVAATLNSAFPALELAVLAGVALRRVRSRPAGPGAVAGDAPVDVEERLYDRLTAAVVTTRGSAGVLMATVGVVLSLFLLAPWSAAGQPAVGPVTAGWDRVAAVAGAAATGATAGDPLAVLTDALVATGALVALPVASGYGVLFWTRAFRRFAALVEKGADATPPVAAVPGLALPATGLVVAWGCYLARFGTDLPVDPAFALAWPPLVAAAAWSVLAARRRRPRTLSGVGRRLVAAHVVFVVAVGGSLAVLVGLQGFGRTLLVPVFTAWIYFLEPVRAVEGAAGDLLRVGYGALPLAAVLLARPVVPVGGALLVVLGALPVALALAVALGRVSSG